jgi:hypothetical protein
VIAAIAARHGEVDLLRAIAAAGRDQRHDPEAVLGPVDPALGRVQRVQKERPMRTSRLSSVTIGQTTIGSAAKAHASTPASAEISAGAAGRIGIVTPAGVRL